MVWECDGYGVGLIDVCVKLSFVGIVSIVGFG